MNDRVLRLKQKDHQALQVLMHQLFSQFPDYIQLVKLFGSKARGEDTGDSDIDLLVVTKERDWSLYHSIYILGARLSLEYDVLFNLYVVDQLQYKKMLKIEHPLYVSIDEHGIDLSKDLNLTFSELST